MKTIGYIGIIVVTTLVASCALITEPDLETQSVKLLAPANNTQTVTRTQTLWWEEVEYADKYNVQIVTPNFEAITRMVVDSNVAGNTFEVTLTPGHYQWMVIAFNESSATTQSVFNLEILSQSGLTGQLVPLLEPSTNANLNTTHVNFAWESLDLANSYLLKVKEGSWGSGVEIEGITSTTNTSYSLVLEEGEYSWAVAAFNDTSSTYTEWQPNAFLVDTTDPGTPVFIVPASLGDTLNATPYQIRWQRQGTSLAAVSDLLVVSEDSLFQSAVLDSITLSATSYSFADWDSGEYWLRIQSVDAAGNRSGYTDSKFYLDIEE